MIRKILVPVDFSEPSQVALEMAERLQQAFSAELMVVAVIDPTGMQSVSLLYETETLKEDLLQRYEDLLSKQVEKAKIQPDRCQKVVKFGIPFMEIVYSTMESGADLLLMGSKAEEGVLRRLFLGDTTYRVIRRVQCSTIAVRTGRAVDAAQPLFRNIVIPVDFSPSSLTALEYSKTLSHAFGAKLHLLNVADSAESTTKAQEKLRGILEDMISEGDLQAEVQTVTTREGPAFEILARCQQVDADLVVIGSQGRRRLSWNPFLGETAYQVARRAECSVLVVKPTPEDKPS